jgi:hypothetical protein
MYLALRRLGVFAKIVLSGGSRRWVSRRCGALAKLPAWERLMKDEDKIKAEKE